MKIFLRDFIISEVFILTGNEEGSKVRKKMNIDTLDEQKCEIIIDIPEYVCSINASFFSGLFYESIRSLGLKEFRNKYRFSCDEHLIDSIEDGINTILLELD